MKRVKPSGDFQVVDCMYLVSGCEEAWVVAEGFSYQGTESVEQVQQLLNILLGILQHTRTDEEQSQQTLQHAHRESAKSKSSRLV